MGLTITGLDEAIAEHEKLASRALDLTPLLEQRRAELQAMIARAWSSRVSPGGDAWAATARESESDGELERACRVRIEGQHLVIEVGEEHASWQFFGTRHQPARNPLPIEWSGGELTWMRRGEAGAWLDGMLERLAAYLAGVDAQEAP